MTKASDAPVQTIKQEIDDTIHTQIEAIHTLNEIIYLHPEFAWKEIIAHDALVSFLSQPDLGFSVRPKVFEIDTAFEATYQDTGKVGRCVNFNAEYDALPGIGHACGHNLITVASLTAFLATAALLSKHNVPGKVQLLGTPAEEDGGGKIALLDAGAYNGVDVSLMGHPFSNVGHGDDTRKTGSAGQRSIAHLGIFCTFHGQNAHASGNPWNGINALDAVVCAYNNISVLRQQLHLEERVHGCILAAPKVTNVIPDLTKVGYSVRGPTVQGTRRLDEKIRACFEAAGLATGCKVEITEEPAYADLRVNDALCEQYTSNILQWGERVCTVRSDIMTGSTDQGNISYVVPALHSLIGIPGPDGLHPHSELFAVAAGTNEVFRCAVRAGKAMAMTAWDVITDDKFYGKCVENFEADKRLRL